ncbi:uncharacterized protein ATNIH1004_006603 [Aspergillus tanneri]|uniref:Uncharacterized protein n=1 Tax=Aspergillus tanneri TaxID=1220188 RepID=A0A5M9MLL9_9EURO|nr:uncharacterized protein ATNIH1004_006603 [Aspergillus tanneri]KAA8647901.1 hypothetical protein ATNIH1004_006603 [Aspergillus tanneri]
MARRIFHERRSSAFARASQAIFGRRSFFGTVHKWLLWLLYDGCYDGSVFDTALKEVYTNKRLFDSLRMGDSSTTHPRLEWVSLQRALPERQGPLCLATSTARRAPAKNVFVWALIETEGYEIVRPAHIDSEPFVWEAARATAAAPFFFPNRYSRNWVLPRRGLRDNLAADIARRLSRQIWPSRKHPARLLSMGTGITDRPRDRPPHFRHVFQDGFLRRGFDAWMSSMDTETKWLEMMGQLEDAHKEDYLRLNIPLRDVPSAIDTIEVMEEYRNLESRYPDVHRLSFTDMERAREIPDTEELMCLLEYCKFRSKLLKGINRRVKKRQNPSAPDTFSHIRDHSND